MSKLIYTTFANISQAKELCRKMVEQKLIACANLSPNMVSIYAWEGKIEESNECYALLKTTNEKVDACCKFLSNHHPYKVPCIMIVDSHIKNHDYKQWVVDCCND